jgi:putative two-component system response regulator
MGCIQLRSVKVNIVDLEWSPNMGMLIGPEALFELSKIRDSDTGNHTLRVGMLAKILALQVQSIFPKEIDEEFVEDIEMACRLHDVGKSALSDNILHKPGELSGDEVSRMREHTLDGATILHSAGLLLAANIAHYHHERWDGTGYPAGLYENVIPLEARICSICDVYDSLLSARPYKDAWSEERTVNYILEEGGAAFDPQIVSRVPWMRFREVEKKFTDDKKEKED